MPARNPSQAAPPGRTESSFFQPRSSVLDEKWNVEAPPVRVPEELPPTEASTARMRGRRCRRYVPLTPNHSSWVVHVPGFCPPPSKRVFREFWGKHPPEKHSLVLFGKPVLENRYSQMYSVAKAKAPAKPTGRKPVDSGGSHQHEYYTYSGTTRHCLPCDPSKRDEKFVVDLCSSADQIVTALLGNQNNEGRTQAHQTLQNTGEGRVGKLGVARTEDEQQQQQQQHGRTIYNCCLVNWYTPDHTIGLHSDNESEMDTSWPIVSVSWGGPRRFLLRPKPPNSSSSSTNHKNKPPPPKIAVHEFWLGDGDLLVMGGRCQEEFRHEVPRVRTTKDGVVGNRISWTLRKMRRKKERSASHSSRTSRDPNQYSSAEGSGERKRNPEFPRTNTTDGKKRAIYNPYTHNTRR